MSKRHAPPTRQASAATSPGECYGAPSDLEEQQKTREWLTQVAAIRDAIAPLVIASGVNEGDDWVEPVAAFLKEPCLAIRDDIRALDERLEQQGIDTDVLNPDFEGPQSRAALSTAVVSLGVGFGRAGYILGLAVGMQLGPHALDAPALGAADAKRRKDR
jgi:hypothetical protein